MEKINIFFIKHRTAIFLGLVVGFAIFVNIANAKVDLPNDWQAGQWISETEQIYTYETVCKGYYIIDYSNKNKIKYTGYGDLDFKYTYEEIIDTDISTTTP